MKEKKEFDVLCRMLLDGSISNDDLPEITVRTQNRFYDCFGMSVEDIQEEFSRQEWQE